MKGSAHDAFALR